MGDDAANPRVIETVPRHGYRLLLPVETGNGAPAERATNQAAPSARPILGDIVAAGLGGAGAGIVAALGYLALGFVAPRIGTASTLMVLLSTNLLLGFAGGGFIGGGIALAARRGGGLAAAALGGAAGGLVIGAVGRMVGTDLFTLFFGRAPEHATGALEGADARARVRDRARRGGALGKRQRTRCAVPSAWLPGRWLAAPSRFPAGG